MVLRGCTLLWVFCISIGASAAPAATRVAIVPPLPSGNFPAAHTVAVLFMEKTAELLRADRRFTERYELASPLEAQTQLLALGCYRADADFALNDCLLEVGRRLRADFVIAGRLHSVPESRSLPYLYEPAVVARVGRRVAILSASQRTLDALLDKEFDGLLRLVVAHAARP